MRPATLGSAASACIAGVEEAVLQRIVPGSPTLGSAASACMAGVVEGLNDSHNRCDIILFKFKNRNKIEYLQEVVPFSPAQPFRSYPKLL